MPGHILQTVASSRQPKPAMGGNSWKSALEGRSKKRSRAVTRRNSAWPGPSSGCRKSSARRNVVMPQKWPMDRMPEKTSNQTSQTHPGSKNHQNSFQCPAAGAMINCHQAQVPYCARVHFAETCWSIFRCFTLLSVCRSLGACMALHTMPRTSKRRYPSDNPREHQQNLVDGSVAPHQSWYGRCFSLTVTFFYGPMHPRLVRLFLELVSHRSPQQSALIRRPTSHRKPQTCKQSSMVIRIGSNSTAVALRQALHWTLSSCKEKPLLENLSDPH